jgi:iron(III) transport system substrate-binding protein
VAIADPRFGSTSFHVAALYVTLGDAKADDFFRRLQANGVKIAPGNSVVRDMVVRAEVKVGLTDTDDVNVAIQGGSPIGMIMPDRSGMGVPMMPNLVSMIADSPHPEDAKQLIDYLLSPEVEAMLAKSEAVQIPLRASVQGPANLPRIDTFQPMILDYAKAAARVEDVTQRLQTILGL